MLSVKKLIISRLACMLLFAAVICLFSGCSKREIENAYSFPDEGLDSFIETDGSLKADGFAHSLCVPDSDNDLDTEGIDADAFALFSLDDGEVLSQHNVYKQEYPASITKIMTCLLALKYGDLDDMVTVPDESDISVSGSSMAGLSPGDRITLRDLLYALMLPSGNDAAVAVACHISGSTDSFADLMNITAKRLGATHSHFVNPHGLPDDEHYTNVYDMYLILNEALKYDDFRTIAGSTEYTCTINEGEDSVNPQKEMEWSTSNAFLTGKFSFADNMEIIAGKTGHTSAAGFCLSLGTKGASGREYIAIIFNSYIYENLYAGMAKLNAKSGE